MSQILEDYGGDILDLSCETPVSRTHQYRKVMKPLLERKRRARINKCLDDLKDLMVTALQTEGESITKLEKADVLELTVRHLQKLNRQRRLSCVTQDQFRDGFASCVAEVGRFVTAASPEATFAPNLMSYLGQRLHAVDQTTTTTTAPISINVPNGFSPSHPSSDCGYMSDRDSISPASTRSSSTSPNPVNFVKSQPVHVKVQQRPVPVWRPF